MKNCLLSQQKMKMKNTLDEFHKTILDFLENNNWGKDIGLREIAKATNLNHPQKVSNKINQLVRMWYIRKNYDNGNYDIFKDNPIPEFMMIPVYSSSQFGKKWFKIPETKPFRKVKIPSDILWISGNDEYFFVKAKDEKFLPSIKSDDLVLIRREKEYTEWKKYLVMQNDIPKIKILKKIWNDSWLISTNVDFDKEEPLMIKDDIRILWSAQKIITSL